MAHSLGLTLYNLARRSAAAPDSPPPPRPDGRLVWLHAPTFDAIAPLTHLARLLDEEDGIACLLTTRHTDLPPQRGLIVQPPPPDTPGPARAFLDHWKPDIAVMTEGELRPSLLHEAQEKRIPLALVDGREPHVPRDREGWWPGLIRATLGDFRAVLTVDEPAARAFRRAGAPAAAVRAVGRLEHPSAALPCTEAERAALAQLLATRPVWFVPSLPQTEEAQVIAAHRSALRLAHRLLLIISPQDASRAAGLAAELEATQGWQIARRSLEEEPEPEVQVFITESSEYGLWYRLAPITYLGGSLSASGCGRDPMEAAALGSAIIHGPRSGKYGAAMGRLAAAQATVLVGTSDDLAESLGELLSPDRSAKLAQAAWAVTSEGSEATEAALKMIRNLIGETV